MAPDPPPLAPSVADMMAADHASRSLGIAVTEAAEGRAVATMSVRPDMVNGHGVAHGAMVFALADTAFASACNSWGPLTVAAGAEIVFVAPARAGDHLVASAVERTRFGNRGIYDVTVTRGSEVVAEFRGQCVTPRSWS